MNRRRAKPDSGVVWFFDTAESEGVEFGLGFQFGVRGDLGALVWDDGAHGLVPVNGVDAATVDYFTGGYGHHVPMPAGAEVPIEVACAALREFMVTRELPTCVNWRQLPDV